MIFELFIKNIIHTFLVKYKFERYLIININSQNTIIRWDEVVQWLFFSFFLNLVQTKKNFWFDFYNILNLVLHIINYF